MDDSGHARLRRMVTPQLATTRILQMRPAIQRIVDGLLVGPLPVDLVETFALPIPSMVICELLGVPYQDHDLFQHHSRTLASRSASPAAGSPTARSAARTPPG
jgi:cytochrome P450